MQRPIVSTLLILAFALSGCATPDNPNPRRDAPQALASVDVPHYMGRWYNIAHVPYILERGYVASYSDWTLRPDGQIDDVFSGKKHSFDGEETHDAFVDTVEPGSNGAQWKVHLFGPFAVTQTTIYVDPQYRYTILGSSDKNLGWIFARSPDIDAATYQDLLSKLDQMGYDTSRFLKVPQHPEDLGKPGYLKDDS